MSGIYSPGHRDRELVDFLMTAQKHLARHQAEADAYARATSEVEKAAHAVKVAIFKRTRAIARKNHARALARLNEIPEPNKDRMEGWRWQVEMLTRTVAAREEVDHRTKVTAAARERAAELRKARSRETKARRAAARAQRRLDKTRTAAPALPDPGLIRIPLDVDKPLRELDGAHDTPEG